MSAARSDAGLSFRPVRAEDLAFLRDLYAATREAELEPVPWTAEQKRVFLDQQFALQDAEYRRAYPDGSFDVVELGGEPVGRLYLNHRESETRIVDLALIAGRQRQGLGSTILARLCSAADEQTRVLSIHVEKFNTGARRLYERFGFRLVEDKGVYLLLVRPAAGGDERSR